MTHSREDLTDRFCSALRETASDYERIEFSEAFDGNLPTLTLFLKVGSDVSAATLDELDLGVPFEEGDEIGLQVVPTPNPPADSYIDAVGEREHADAVRRAVGERLASDWREILSDEDMADDARDLARAIARDLGLPDRR